MRKLLSLCAVLVGALAIGIVPAAAITDGELDGNGHPGVVLLLMEVNNAPAFRCSATLLSATVVLTAGHCTNNFPDSPYTGMRVFTQSDVESGIGTTNNYPFAGPNSVEAVSWAAHPLYQTAPFFVHDVGVVILQAPGVVLPQNQYGVLPAVNSLDSLATKRGHQDRTFTSVGYGLQQINPVHVQVAADPYGCASEVESDQRRHRRRLLASSVEQSFDRWHLLRRLRRPEFPG